jgi:hypothetical protein
MKVTKILRTVLCVAALGSVATTASAVPTEIDAATALTYGITSVGGCSASLLTPDADECLGVVTNPNNNNGNGADEAAAFLLGEWGITGVTGGEPSNPTDSDSDPLTWTIDLGSLVSGPFAIGLKQSNGWSLYYYDMIATQYVSFTTNIGFGGDGNLDISHWTLYGGSSTTVPEPTSLALLGLGLAGLGFARRRRS